MEVTKRHLARPKSLGARDFHNENQECSLRSQFDLLQKANISEIILDKQLSKSVVKIAHRSS